MVVSISGSIYLHILLNYLTDIFLSDDTGISMRSQHFYKWSLINIAGLKKKKKKQCVWERKKEKIERKQTIGWLCAKRKERKKKGKRECVWKRKKVKRKKEKRVCI